LWLAIGSASIAHAAAGESLGQIKSRGTLRCGVSEGILGFSARDQAGRWTGLDVDFCRAVAAAALGDANKVSFVPLQASARFIALKSGTIDLLSRNTTWTFDREAGLHVRFAGVLFYDGQGFMVPRKKAPKALAGLRGASVCVEKGTTSAQHLVDYSAARRLDMTALVFDSARELVDAFTSGRCRALTADASRLAATRLRLSGDSRGFLILPERISKEPLGPVVRGGDEEWLTIVRWVLIALVGAEESEVTRDNVRERMRDVALRRVLRPDDDISKALGLDPDWAFHVIRSVGNYGEMFERNVGAASPLKLERGLNRLWTEGGLMYAPPMR
jgi:general L-amino acid transport system substrate-binding protein